MSIRPTWKLFLRSYSSETQIAYNAVGLSKRYYSGNSPFYLQPVSIQLKTGQITGVVGGERKWKNNLAAYYSGAIAK
jgi:hypothetical protein